METVLDLFSGIGGFSLGLGMAGFKTVAFCEIDPFCQKILNQHWPELPIYFDISSLNKERLSKDGIDEIDIITGGFPCQDLSVAGKQRGVNGETRSGLWGEMRRLIGEIRPRFAIMENVPNFLSGDGGNWFGEFLRSLAEIGYDAEWGCISAGAVGKPHLRERVWVVAYPHGFMRKNNQGQIFSGDLPKNDQSKRSQQTGRGLSRFKNSLKLLPEHLRVDDGLPVRMDEIKGRVKALGNSIVPEIAYLIGQQIRAINP